MVALIRFVIERPKLDVILIRSNTSRERSLAEIQTLAEVIALAPYRGPSAAIRRQYRVRLGSGGRVDFIAIGDLDLLDLKAFQHAPIIESAEALRRIGALI